MAGISLLVAVLAAGTPNAGTSAVPDWYAECARLAGSPAEPMLEGAGVELADLTLGRAGEAVTACRRALNEDADPDAPETQFRLGRAYGAAELAEDAVRYYRLAAEAGYAPAQNNLATSYQRGLGVPQDSAEAVRWYEAAAAQGFAIAAYNLGIMYRYGNGVEADGPLALDWLTRAAEADHPDAQLELSYLLLPPETKGVALDPEAAAMWAMRAAEAGLPDAEVWLAYLYETGQGVEADLRQARRWYRTAASHGISIAQQRLDELEAGTE